MIFCIKIRYCVCTAPKYYINDEVLLLYWCQIMNRHIIVVYFGLKEEPCSPLCLYSHSSSHLVDAKAAQWPVNTICLKRTLPSICSLLQQKKKTNGGKLLNKWKLHLFYPFIKNWIQWHSFSISGLKWNIFYLIQFLTSLLYLCNTQLYFNNIWYLVYITYSKKRC